MLWVVQLKIRWSSLCQLFRCCLCNIGNTILPTFWRAQSFSDTVSDAGARPCTCFCRTCSPWSIIMGIQIKEPAHLCLGRRWRSLFGERWCVNSCCLLLFGSVSRAVYMIAHKSKVFVLGHASKYKILRMEQVLTEGKKLGCPGSDISTRHSQLML